MNMLTLRDVSVAFGAASLLDEASLVINAGDRIALIGRNGTGKSTLLRLLEQQIMPDSGSIERRSDVRVATLLQEVPTADEGTVLDVILQGAGERARLVRDYMHISHSLDENYSEKLMAQLSRVQHELEAVDGWALEHQAETVVSKLGLDSEVKFNDLSGGARRRVLLGQALLAGPDLLLLDEPTNHLDVATIEWLEKFLLDSGLTLVFVTHDRAFLRKMANRIVELDRGKLTDWPGDYENYLRRKEERAHAEALENERFDKKLAQEETWIRQGIKARRTRNEGRVRALQAMREQHRQRRARTGTAELSIQQAESSAKRVVELEHLSFAWNSQPVVRDFSFVLQKGDRIGLVGPNGVGKTTLIKLMLGELEADSGTVKRGPRLQAVWFDQLRAQLDPDKTVADNVADGSDYVELDGKRRHVISYLNDFLFESARARSPVNALSGGEKARLLLARLFARPSNLLVLDEPTNDLDIETLELLEERLMEYQGTILLVSHDRAFLDNVVTDCLFFEGDGKITMHVGGWSDIEAAKASMISADAGSEAKAKPVEAVTRPTSKPKKLSYKDQRALDSLPAQIERLEQDVELLQEKLSDPDIYRDNPQSVTDINDQLSARNAELEHCYSEWERLEALREGLAE